MLQLISFLFIFFVGVIISFGIGAFIGYLIWLKYRNKQIKKAKFYVVCGGILYIASQPIVLILFACLSIIMKTNTPFGISDDNILGFFCMIICAILLAISLTIISLFLIAKRQVKLFKPLMDSMYLV